MQQPLVSPAIHAHQPLQRCCLHVPTSSWKTSNTSPGSRGRKAFEDDTLTGGQTTIEYVAPFFKLDREEDYRRAWAFFANQQDKESLQ